MQKPTILVTGATGRTGSEVVAQLRARQWPVRAVVRRRDARSAQLERLGAEIAVADLFDAESLTAAMRGTSRAYYCPPVHPYMIQSAAAFATAARAAGIEFIAGLTQWLAGPSHPALQTRQHWLADQLLSHLPGIGYTRIEPGFFAEYPYLAVIRFAVHLGIFPMALSGDSRNAPPSNADIAAVSVATLVDPDRYAGGRYRPTGPQLISIAEMAATIARVFARPVRHVQMPMWMFVRAARLDGTPPLLLDALHDYFHENASGAFAYGGPTTDVADMTGRPAESFESIVRRYATLPHLQPTLGNRLRTLADFLRTPLSPGFDRERYRRNGEHPAPAVPQFALESDTWIAEHTRSDRPAFRGAEAFAS